MKKKQQPLDVILAVHGILTGRSNPTWPERLQRFLASRANTVVIADQYDAGPFPRLNWFLENPKRAKAMAALLAEYANGDRPVRLHIVAHSNGCDIARRTARILTTNGITVHTLILVSGAVAKTARRLGLQEAIERNTLKRLIAYVGTKDGVLPPRATWSKPWTVVRALLAWPYGNLGRYGFRDAHERRNGSGGIIALQICNRIYGWGHCDFFPREFPNRMLATFETIEGDLLTYDD